MQNGKDLSRGRIITGASLTLLGLILLIGEFVEPPLTERFWPIFLLLGGLLFYAGYFSGKGRQVSGEGLLFPGTYLIVLGALFLLLNFIGWKFMKYLWPTFILGVAVSLWVIFLFTPAENAAGKKTLRSGIITLTLVSAALYLMTLKAAFLWPIVIIVIGIIIIVRSLKTG